MNFYKYSRLRKQQAKTGNSKAAVAVKIIPGEAEADQILFAACDEIVAGNVFNSTDETRAAEADVNRAYKDILNGGSDFNALRQSCACWIQAAGQKPAVPETISLWPGVD